jgi:hypothetical protein
MYVPDPFGVCDSVIYLNLVYSSGPAVPAITQTGSLLVAVAPSNLSFQWYLNGTPILNATGQVYTPIQNGVYTVQVSDGNSLCFPMSAGYSVTGVGINEVNSNLSYQFSPNPNNGRFTLTVADYSGVEMTVYDIFGREVYEKKMSQKTETITLDVAEGTYVLRLKGNGAQAVTKFVIAR